MAQMTHLPRTEHLNDWHSLIRIWRS